MTDHTTPLATIRQTTIHTWSIATITSAITCSISKASYGASETYIQEVIIRKLLLLRKLQSVVASDGHMSNCLFA